MARWLDVRGKSRREGIPNKSLPGAPEDKGTPSNPLAGVVFASDEAAELAAKNGLTAARFEGAEQTGVTGFTKADVERLIG